MTRRFDIAALKAISHAPATGEADWLISAEGSIVFLKENAQSEEIVIYASGPATLVHAVRAPLKQVTPADQEDLMHAFVQTDESWVIQKSYGGGEGHRVYLEAPLRSGKSLSGGGGEAHLSPLIRWGAKGRKYGRTKSEARACAWIAFRGGA